MSTESVSTLFVSSRVHGVLKYEKRCPLSQIGWNVDGLLLHIILNRRTSRAREDVQLLRGTLDHFATIGPQNEGKSAADALAIMYKVAMEAIA